MSAAKAKPVNDIFEIETANQTYKVKRPKGLVGIRHFKIMQRASPTKEDILDDGESLSPRYLEQLTLARDEWCEKVLPDLLVDSTIEDVYAEDFFALFTAMMQQAKILPEVFRIL